MKCLQRHTHCSYKQLLTLFKKILVLFFFPWTSTTSLTLLELPLGFVGPAGSDSCAFVFVFLWHLLSLCHAEEAAVIVSGLRSTDVFVGESATFTCELSQPGVRNVQWWLDGTPLHNNLVTEISEQDGRIHTLTLNDVACHDSGTVTFRAGPLISSAKLLVKGISLSARNTCGPAPCAGASAFQATLTKSFTVLLCPAALPPCKAPQNSSGYNHAGFGSGSGEGRVAGSGLLLSPDLKEEMNTNICGIT